MDKFEKKLLIATSILFAVLVLGGFVVLQALKQATAEIDSHGGLKALVERVWEGKK